MVWNLYPPLFHTDHVLCCDLFLSLSQRTRKFILVLILRSCLKSPPIQQLNIYFQPQAKRAKTLNSFFCLFVESLLYLTWLGKVNSFLDQRTAAPKPTDPSYSLSPFP